MEDTEARARIKTHRALLARLLAEYAKLTDDPQATLVAMQRSLMADVQFKVNETTMGTEYGSTDEIMLINQQARDLLGLPPG